MVIASTKSGTAAASLAMNLAAPAAHAPSPVAWCAVKPSLPRNARRSDRVDERLREGTIRLRGALRVVIGRGVQDEVVPVPAGPYTAN